MDPDINTLKTFTLREAKTIKLSVDDPVLITGPSGSGKDYIAREICAPEFVCSLDHIGYWPDKRQWLIEPDQVQKLINARKWKIFTGVSDSEIVWIHFFRRIMIPWITLETSQSTVRKKIADRNKTMREKGKPEDGSSMWKIPPTLKDMYHELYKPRPFGFKGMVARVINDRSVHQGFAWSDWNHKGEDIRRDEIRKIAGYTKEQEALRKAHSAD